MSRNSCIDNLKCQLTKEGIANPESLGNGEITPLTGDVLEYVCGGGFSEFSSFTRTLTDGTVVFSETYHNQL